MSKSRREALLRTKQAYENTFFGERTEPHPEASRVLADLRKFCGILKGGLIVSPKSGMTDPYATAYRAGQRDVYLRIATFLHLDDKSLFQEPEHDNPQSQPVADT